jgi:hypothetical protein
MGAVRFAGRLAHFICHPYAAFPNELALPEGTSAESASYSKPRMRSGFSAKTSPMSDGDSLHAGGGQTVQDCNRTVSVVDALRHSTKGV